MRMAAEKFYDQSSFVIFGWMTNKLGLVGLKREIYAIIFGFTQVEGARFRGSKKYLAEATNTSIITVNRILKELVIIDGFILEDKDDEGNIMYYANLDILD
jgi:hypothetical protein